MLTKEEIIKELQRCAKENGGKTPSSAKFKEITGVGPYDLHKHSWSNYGELVHEAGRDRGVDRAGQDQRGDCH